MYIMHATKYDMYSVYHIKCDLRMSCRVIGLPDISLET